ncbi:SRPBCC domain-containing protein [Sphingobacterium sp. N143]|uniref:SRPBCC domain-containing protein n=1 Tax=Sphingobacterium sp. N143 TaxID=2746727 RepID=UPI0025760B5E|nr:SRPBCC domain-containing protein [Sphingobacterium sp. N143]MDM1294702.1 SRPBCC domain-containing protein [Sphingobacterium sp. N143]
MEQKTKINAEAGKQELVITRTFDLPVELLFKAYSEAELIEQWMGTKVIKLESKNHGSYQFETSYQGKVAFKANGTIHTVVPNQKIIRTFEMENAPIGVQLEFLTFEKLNEDTSKLKIQIIYQSEGHRAEQLKLPFASGLNMAHDRLQEIINKLK